MYPVPKLPWTTVSCDLFQLYGRSYVVMVDSYSGFIEVEPLADTSTSTVIRVIKANIARYGVMDTFISDNGPQFTSREFKDFIRHYRINHVTSSPEYAQSNGLAERAVQTVKSLTAKTIQDRGDIYLALLELRNTPRNSTLGSPAQRLMGRRTKTLLPIATKLLQPKHVEPQKVHNKLTSLRTQQKRYYDRGTKPLHVIRPGDAVRLQTPQGWRPAEVIRQHESPRSYVIKSGELAHEYRRNRNRLMITPETPHVIKPQFTRRRLIPPGTPVRRPQVLDPESPQVLVPESPPKSPPKSPPTLLTPATPHAPPTPHQPEVRRPNTISQQPGPSRVTTRSGCIVQKPSYLKDYVA